MAQCGAASVWGLHGPQFILGTPVQVVLAGLCHVPRASDTERYTTAVARTVQCCFSLSAPPPPV